MRRPFLITFLTSILILLLNITAGIITARTLGPQGKGMLRTLIIWPTILSQIALLGIHESYIYLKNNGENTKVLKSTIFFAITFFSLFFSIITLFLFATILHKKLILNHGILFALIFYIPVASLLQTGLSILQERMHFFRYNLVRIAMPIIYLSLLLLNIKRLSPEVCFLLLFFSNLLLFVIVAPVFKGIKPALFKKSVLHKSLKFGIKTQLANILGSFAQQTDQAILSIVSSPYALGIYSVAVSISRVGFIAPNAAQIVLYPILSRKSIYSIKKYVIYLSLFNASIWIFLFFTIDRLVKIFYGNAFIKSSKVAILLFAVSFPVSVIYTATAYFKAKGVPIKTTIAQGIVFVLLVLLIPVFYYFFKLTGTAVATILAYTGGAAYYLLSLRSISNDT